MEVTIRTLDQAREERVTIEVNGARVYTAAEVGDAQASEAELVSTFLRRELAEVRRELARYRRNHVCTEDCSENQHVAFTGKGMIHELRAELIKEKAAREESDKAREELAESLVVQRKCAEDNREWTKLAENRLSTLGMDYFECRKSLADARRKIAEQAQSIGARDELLSTATTALRKIYSIVFSSVADNALSRMEPSETDYVNHLADTVREVRGLITGCSSPTLLPSPDNRCAHGCGMPVGVVHDCSASEPIEEVSPGPAESAGPCLIPPWESVRPTSQA